MVACGVIAFLKNFSYPVQTIGGIQLAIACVPLHFLLEERYCMHVFESFFMIWPFVDRGDSFKW